MKRFLSLLATGALALILSTPASAQTRGVSGGALILDDLHGNSMTLTTPLYGSPEWEAWAFNGFPSVWYAPVPPANGAQDAFIYSGPIPAYGTGSISPALIAYWVPPGVTGINNPGGAAGAWDYATAGQLGISGAGDNLDQYVIPMSDGAGDWVASSLTDNGTTVSTPEDISPNTLTLPNAFIFSSPSQNDLSLTSIDNTFNLHLNTDASDGTDAGQFNVYFSGNGTPTFSVQDHAIQINGTGENGVELDLNGSAGSSGQFLESQGGGNTPIWANAVTEVDAGTGLTGGPINTTGTLSIANSGVEAGTYGDATDVGQFTVNAQGQITSASDVSILLPNANLVNSTIGITSTGTTMTVTGSPISLGSSGNIDLNLAHANTWTAIQTFPNLSITVPELASSTIGHTSTGSTLVVPGAIGLGNSGNFEINLAHANTWTAAQTFPAGSITNAELANSSVTVTAGTGLSGGGTATLGGAAVTLTNAGVTSITGTASQITASASTGAVTLSLPATINVNTTGNAATATTVTTDANLTGPVTSVGNATTITNSAVTYAKIQNVTNARLLGNNSGAAAAPEEISVGSGLTLSGTTLSATGTGATYAHVQTASANSAAITSTTGEMAGFSNGVSNFTPSATGTVMIVMTGNIATGTGGDPGSVQMKWGTGNGPAHATAVTGTSIGSQATVQPVGATHDELAPFTCSAVVTGWTLAPHWIDADVFATTSNAVTLSDVEITIVELP